MQKLQKRISGNSFVFVSAIISFITLVAIVFLFPVEFSGYKNTDVLAPIWYLITQTGGVAGSTVIVLVLLIYLLTHFKKKSKRIRNVYLFIAIITFVQILNAGSTLFYFKDVFKNQRPSQLYFTEKGFIEPGGREYFAMPHEEKRKYIQKKIDEDKSKLEEIYPPILDSWISDSGYSFPSGHSQTAFFLGTILAFVIYKTNSKKYFIFIPLAWAILVALSRVVIGVHYPIDVTAGAFIGLILALITISLKKVNQIFE